ncbi:hypothetical protein [Streptosporangium sp. NPDC051022]|uniref:hypothetical protein n=1 Tax=Streptosporangium sp. NPDC051022 TaxID=3155752 RepID=UPI00342DDA6A
MAAALTGVLVLIGAVTGAALLVLRVTPGAGQEAQGARASALSSDPAPTTGESADPGAVAYIDDIRPGTCVNEVFDNTVFEKDSGVLPLASCTDAHDGEVLTRFLLPGREWPGRERVRAMAVEGCRGRLAPIFEHSPIAEQLTSLAFAPLRAEWPEDRLVVCVAVHKEIGFLFRPVEPPQTQPAVPAQTEGAPVLGA